MKMLQKACLEEISPHKLATFPVFSQLWCHLLALRVTSLLCNDTSAIGRTADSGKPSAR